MSIPLGFEVGTGKEVCLPLHHMVVTGLTRLSGKTTTAEAIMARLPKGFSALAFRTKRGEVAFQGARTVQPFLVTRTDWEYVQSLLEAAMRERLRFERSWIIKSTKGARNLRDVYERIVTARDSGKIRSLDESVYTNLAAYFEKVLPQIESHPFAGTLHLHPGGNVMDLGHLSEEVQALVIASSLEEISQHGANTLVVIPEAWQFIPQQRGNPVKWAAQHVIRKGGSVGVYMVLDSQDVTGIEKQVLKSCDVWLLGRQRERNEVVRVLAQLPVPRGDRPRPDEVMTLGVGQFYVTAGDSLRKVYVRPVWMSSEEAQEVALTGQPAHMQRPARGPEEDFAAPPFTSAPEGPDFSVLSAPPQELEEDPMWKEKAEELEEDLKRTQELNALFASDISSLRARLHDIEATLPALRQKAALGAAAERLRDALVEFLHLIAPSGSTPEQSQVLLAPAEALREKYQQEAMGKLERVILGLDPDQRKILGLLRVAGKLPRAELARHVGTPATQFTGQAVSRWHQQHLTALSTAGLISWQPKTGEVFYAMPQAVKREIGVLHPSEEEIQAVVENIEHFLAGQELAREN